MRPASYSRARPSIPRRRATPTRATPPPRVTPAVPTARAQLQLRMRDVLRRSGGRVSRADLVQMEHRALDGLGWVLGLVKRDVEKAVVERR